MTSKFASPVKNLTEMFRARAQERPEQIAFTFLEEARDEPANLSYGELDLRARTIAAHLQNYGAAGERGLVVLPPGLDYIMAIAGSLYAGLTFVPAYPQFCKCAAIVLARRSSSP